MRMYGIGLALVAGVLAGCAKEATVDVAEDPAGAVRLIEAELVKVPRVGNVGGFLMGKTEVTQTQWQMVMGSNPSQFKGADRPVENVSYEDCLRFISKLNAAAGGGRKGRFRLPTEAEWMHACLAGASGDVGLLPKAVAGDLEVMAWFADNSGDTTKPVAQKRANAWGLYDMHGNVQEWTSTSNGVAKASKKAADTPVYIYYKGGSWADSARKCFASDNGRFGAAESSPTVGLRLVRQ